MGSKKRQVVGYHYYFGIHMGVCRGPIDELVEIQVGEKVVWQGSVTAKTTWIVDQPTIFGGDDGEGGISGGVTAFFGNSTQFVDPSTSATAYITSSGKPGWRTVYNEYAMRVTLLGKAAADAGAPLPGYRGTFTVFYDGMVCSGSPYPKPWKFRVRRASSAFQPGLAAVWMSRPLATGEVADANIKAMNPAHIIYECLTNREWGRGLPSSAIDLPSFTAAASRLVSEGFGLCLKWSRRDTIEAFVQNVLEHINATIYTDRQTALIKLSLVRADYVASELPLFDAENGLQAITEATVAAMHSSVNEVRVDYVDPITGQTRSVAVDNLANVQASAGAYHSMKKDYPGIPTEALARRVAQRELRVYGSTLRRFSIVLDRRAWNIAPGAAIRIQDVPRGIPDTVVRVGAIDYGSMTDGKIKMSVVQDVFALPTTSFTGTEPPQWAPINNNPCVGRHRVFEVPYGLLAATMDASQLDYVVPEAGYVGAIMEQGRPTNAGFRMMVKSGAPAVDENPPNNDHLCSI
jgi:hypothetical protein